MHADAPEMVVVAAGEWRPAYPATADEDVVRVEAFRLDRTPVTNAQFLAFVKAHPEWRRGAVKPLLADEGYLAHWGTPDALGNAGPAQPVTNVSWFAARAFCEARGARLPTEAEWEYAADDADPDQDIEWYGRPADTLRDVGGPRNRWGVSDLHGLVWEWVEDFNGNMVTGDDRNQGGKERSLWCGAGALGAQNRDDYAAFMRLAFRGSLRARYTARSLGFRCAEDL